MNKLIIVLVSIISLLGVFIFFQQRKVSKLEYQIEREKLAQEQLMIEYIQARMESKSFLDSLNVELAGLQIQRDSLSEEYLKVKQDIERIHKKKQNFDTLSALQILHEFQKRMYKR